MTVGVPKEVKEQEFRVALLPAAVYQLVKRGHHVLVESNAGSGIGFHDADYRAAGAKVVQKHEETFSRADMIVKVKEPLESEYELLREGQILFTYLHLAANRLLTECLIATGATCIAYETVEVNRRLPLLEPMSEIAKKHFAARTGYVNYYFNQLHRDRVWKALVASGGLTGVSSVSSVAEGASEASGEGVEGDEAASGFAEDGAVAPIAGGAARRGRR
jgi:alanine dehydrogenase